MDIYDWHAVILFFSVEAGYEFEQSASFKNANFNLSVWSKKAFCQKF